MGKGSAFAAVRRRLRNAAPGGALRQRVLALEAVNEDRQQVINGLRRRQRAAREELARLSRQADVQQAQLKTLTAELKDLRKQLEPFARASELRSLEHNRLGLQFGAIEERLGRLEEQVSDGVFVADSEETAEARRLVDAVRREHEQIRVRMQIISAYEERLRRVEATADLLYEGDPRHPV